MELVCNTDLLVAEIVNNQLAVVRKGRLDPFCFHKEDYFHTED